MRYLILLLLLVLSASAMNISENGLNMIKKFEGLRLKAYKCPADVWTIGYGHTVAEPGQKINKNQADSLLRKDVRKFERYVNNRIRAPLNQNQFDALVDHSFNIGSIYGNLYRYIQNRQHKLAAIMLGKYIRAKGRILPGLVKRANARKQLYLTPVS